MTHWTDTQKQALWAAVKRGDKLLYHFARHGASLAPGVIAGADGEHDYDSDCCHAREVWVAALRPPLKMIDMGRSTLYESDRVELIGRVMPHEAIFSVLLGVKAGNLRLGGASLWPLASAHVREAGTAYWEQVDLRGAYLPDRTRRGHTEFVGFLLKYGWVVNADGHIERK